MGRGVLGVLVLAAAASAQPAAVPGPAVVIGKAIEAHGGLEVLKKYPAGMSKFAGKMVLDGKDFPFTGALAFAVPGKARLEMTVESFGRTATLVQLVNGDAVKEISSGVPSKLDPATQAELKETAVIQELSLLFPLLDPGKYTLASEPAATVDGRACSVVLVKAKGVKDARLYFEQKTGLLTGMRREGLSPTQKKVDDFTVFSEYRPVGGMMVPMRSRVLHDGRPFMDLAVSEYRPLPMIDEKTFAVD